MTNAQKKPHSIRTSTMLKAFWTKKKPIRSILDNPAKPTRIVFLRPQWVPNSPEGNAQSMKDKVIEPVNIEAVPASIPRENTAMDESPVSNALKAINHRRILVRIFNLLLFGSFMIF